MKAGKLFAIGAGAFLIFRGMKLYQLIEKFDYSLKGAKVSRDGTDAVLNVSVVLKNPTNTIVGIDKITGDMFVGNIGLGTFVIPAFNFNPGETQIMVNVKIGSVSFLNAVESALKAKKLPVITTRMRTFLRGIPFGIPSKIETPLKDYVPTFLK